MEYVMQGGLLVPKSSSGGWVSPTQWISPDFVGELRKIADRICGAFMAGFTPDEAETLMGEVVFKRTSADRDTDLELGLFTNAAPGETITEATITEPTGTGYARITLTDASWTVASSVASYPQQTFTGGAGGWTGSIQGYFIATKAAAGTKRLLAVEVDASGPYTIAESDTYKITPQITFN